MAKGHSKAFTRSTMVKAAPQVDPLSVLDTKPIASWAWPRVVAFVPQFPAIPHGDKVFYNFWMIAMQGLPIMKVPYGRTDYVRNQAGVILLKSDYTHVLMLDQDHAHPYDIVQRLCRWVVLDPRKLVVGALNFRRTPPYDPCAFIYGPGGALYPPIDWEKGLIKVDAIGTGSLLIAREVFELLEPPWFFNDYSRIMEDHWPGEDIGFSKKCNAAGIDLWCDTTTTSPHLTESLVTEESYRSYLASHNDEFITVEELEESKRKEAEDAGIPAS